MGGSVILRLALGFALVTLIGGAIGFAGFRSSQILVNELHEITDQTTQELVAWGKINALSEKVHGESLGVAAVKTEAKVVQYRIAKINLDDAIAEIEALAEDAHHDKLLGIVETEPIVELQTAAEELVDASDALVLASRTQQESRIIWDLINDVENAQTKLIRVVDHRLAQETDELSQRRQYANELSMWTGGFVVLISSLGVLTIVLLGLLITRYISRLMTDLQRARDEALEASRAKSEFLAGMSHEIRTPMNAIVGMADLLGETTLQPDQQEYVRVFRNAGENLMDIINQILDLSKVEAGQLKLEEVEFDLGEMVETTAQVLALRAHEKGLELNCHVSPELPRLMVGDPVRLRQIVTNLAGNAVKFTSKGEVVIEVKPDPQSQDPGVVLLSVSDTGIGIAPEKLEMIFEDFSQADTSITRQYGGTGLGLSICRHFVEMMDGRMWVESTVGEGSKFYATLRLGVSEDPDLSETLDLEDLEGLRTLIVDDNPTNRMILKETLQSWGARPTTAESGYRALAEIRQAKRENNPYQLVLLDRRMPGMDGFAVAEQIQREIDGGMTIMMLTSENRSEDIGRCQQLGMARYLIKPVGRSELFRAIAAALTPAASVASDQATSQEIVKDVEGQAFSILLVEDSKDNQLLIKSYLKSQPYQIDLAENGQEAVEKFTASHQHYDLVLMDMQMPVMDGYTATRQIRDWEREQERDPTPVIALTAHALKEDQQKSLDAGCTNHLTKPIKKAALLEAIQEHTQQGALVSAD